MENYYYKVELNKGYIPSDKVRVHNQPYEIGGVFEDTKAMLKYFHSRYMDAGKEHRRVILRDIDRLLATELEDMDYEQKDTSIKPFYLNINRDGIDVFGHRWNWKEKENWTPKKIYTCDDCGAKYRRAHSCRQMINKVKAIG